MQTNELPWRKVASSYPVEVRFDSNEKATVIEMLVLTCKHRQKGTPGQTRARCKRCRKQPA